MAIKVYTVFIDGIDKTGKDTVAAYVDYLSGRKYVAKSRGIISQVAYSKLYGRNYEYVPSEKNVLHVFLTVDYEDWKVRCAINRESKIDYKQHCDCFEEAVNELKDKVLIMKANTSVSTPYSIAKAIVELMSKLNEEAEEANHEN